MLSALSCLCRRNGYDFPIMGAPESCARNISVCGIGLIRENAASIAGIIFCSPGGIILICAKSCVLPVWGRALRNANCRHGSIAGSSSAVVGAIVLYQANCDSRVFGELRALAVKTAGIADVLREAITKFRDRIALAFAMVRLRSRGRRPAAMWTWSLSET